MEFEFKTVKYWFAVIYLSFSSGVWKETPGSISNPQGTSVEQHSPPKESCTGDSILLSVILVFCKEFYLLSTLEPLFSFFPVTFRTPDHFLKPANCWAPMKRFRMSEQPVLTSTFEQHLRSIWEAFEKHLTEIKSIRRVEGVYLWVPLRVWIRRRTNVETAACSLLPVPAAVVVVKVHLQ